MGRKYPALFLLFFIVAGIIIADQSRIDALWFFSFSVVSLLVGLFLINRRTKTAIIFFGLTFLSFSAFHFGLKYYTVSQNHIENFIELDRRFDIFGEISDFPDLKLDQTEIKVDVDSILLDNRTYRVDGAILLIITDTTTYFQRNDKLSFSGKIYPVEGNSFGKEFDYNRYLRNHGISGRVYQPTIHDIRLERSKVGGLEQAVTYLRDWIRETLYVNLSQESAALASGFLIGETRNIPVDIYQNFKMSGTLHLLAVSGSNVALVIFFFILLLIPFRISRLKRNLILIFVVIIFTVLAYNEPSVVRASVMAILVLVASSLSRRIDLNQVIALAAVLILLYDPAELFDLGFQLSFVIAWGLIFTMPRLSKIFEAYHNKFWYRFLLFPFLVSLVAQIYSIGLIGLYFQKIPLISPIANLFIVPLVSAVVVGVLLLLVASFLLPILGLVVGTPLNLLIELTLFLVNLFGNDAIPKIEVPNWSILGVAIFYLILFISAAAITNRRALRIALLAALLAGNLFLIQKAYISFTSGGEVVVEASSIPGGILTLIKGDVSKVSDLVITSASKKDYSISEKIIAPFLNKSKVERINNLVILSADYDCFRDFLTLDSFVSVEHIYIPNKYKAQVEDIISIFDFSEIDNKVIFYDSNIPADLKAGLNLANEYLCYKEKDFKVLIASKFSDGLKSELLDSDYLIISSPIITSETNLEYLLKGNNLKVICSKVEQSSQTGQGLSYKERVIDLYSRTSFVIKRKLTNR